MGSIWYLYRDNTCLPVNSYTSTSSAGAGMWPRRAFWATLPLREESRDASVTRQGGTVLTPQTFLHQHFQCRCGNVAQKAGSTVIWK